MGEFVPTSLDVFARQFNVCTPQFLKEAAENCEGGMYAICWNIFRDLLAQVAGRASELNDPIMNVLMLRLGLYDVRPSKVAGIIEEIRISLADTDYLKNNKENDYGHFKQHQG